MATGTGTIKGVVGQIMWGYYPAASINGYTVVRNGTAWSLRATVVMSDAFKMTQKPLIFIAPHQHGRWSWPIKSVQIQNGALTAELGPPDQ
jgi:hypothetical protein